MALNILFTNTARFKMLSCSHYYGNHVLVTGRMNVGVRNLYTVLSLVNIENMITFYERATLVNSML